MEVSEWADAMTLDTVAECVDGIGDLYRKLWELMTSEPRTNNDEPPYETPGDALGQGPNILANHWQSFSESEQATLTQALAKHFE